MTYKLDRRTRRDAERRFINPAQFFTQEIPKLIAVNGHLVAKAMTALDAPPLCLEVDGEAWTLKCAGDSVQGAKL